MDSHTVNCETWVKYKIKSWQKIKQLWHNLCLRILIVLMIRIVILRFISCKCRKSLKLSSDVWAVQLESPLIFSLHKKKHIFELVVKYIWFFFHKEFVKPNHFIHLYPLKKKIITESIKIYNLWKMPRDRIWKQSGTWLCIIEKDSEKSYWNLAVS